ncbi:hypothetical protein [Kitasatospora sp. NPDC057541]
MGGTGGVGGEGGGVSSAGSYRSSCWNMCTWQYPRVAEVGHSPGAPTGQR